MKPDKETKKRENVFNSYITILGELHYLLFMEKKEYKFIKKLHEDTGSNLAAIGMECFHVHEQSALDMFLNKGQSERKDKCTGMDLLSMLSYARSVQATHKNIQVCKWETEDLLKGQLILAYEILKQLDKLSKEHKDLIAIMDFFTAYHQNMQRKYDSKYTAKVLDYAKKKGIDLLAIDHIDPEAIEEHVKAIFELTRFYLEYLITALNLLLERKGSKKKDEIDAKLGKLKKEFKKKSDVLHKKSKKIHKRIFKNSNDTIVRTVDEYCSEKASNVVLLVGNAHLEPLRKAFYDLGYTVNAQPMLKFVSAKEFEKMPNILKNMHELLQTPADTQLWKIAERFKSKKGKK